MGRYGVNFFHMVASRLKQRFFCTLVFLTGLVFSWAGSGFDRDGDSGDTWLIQVEDGVSAKAVAESLGAEYLRPLVGVDGYHRIRYLRTLKGREFPGEWKEEVARKLASRPEVMAFEEEEWIEVFPRNFQPMDPLFLDQWHLDNVGQSGGLRASDVRVRPVWNRGIDGRGVTIAIVDEGIEFRHPDLMPNWVVGSGYDYNDRDNDPSPSGNDDRHGTAVAGIALAASNSIGGLGIAHRAGLVPLRLIAGPFRTGDEAEALSYRRDEVDIYNNSWGPSDRPGVRYADASNVLKSALASNVRQGRGGRGNIYVWAAGNGGINGDNSNYDGYNASPYTISVGAVGHDDIRAGYSEPGANLLLVAPSGGRGAGILTTDNTGFSGYTSGDFYTNFSGTSAAAPMVSGVVALMLQARPSLGWRDVQQILALAAVPVDLNDGGWSRNGAGYWVSHYYGFGRVDAASAVRLAEVWPILGEMVTARMEFSPGFGAAIPLPQGESVSRSLFFNQSIRTQFVRVEVVLSHSNWGDLRIEVTSPSGTRSVLAEPHPNANTSGQPGRWTYLSTHHLNELSSGDWTLTIRGEGNAGSGSLIRWSVDVWGTDPSEQTNRPPVAEDLSLKSARFPIEVDVLEGVMDPDGDPVTLLSVQPPGMSELTDLGNGRFRFSMGETQDGTDHFSVLLWDGRGGVTRRIVHVLDPRPVGQNDIFTVLSGDPVSLPVLLNDFDPDNDPLRLVALRGDFVGTATISEDNRILYQSPPGFTGVERIQYELTDDSDGNSTAWATVIVEETLDLALEFDGVDDFVRLQNAPGILTNDRFTAEAWIYPEDWGEYVTGFGRIFDRDTFVFFLNGFDHDFYNDQSLVAYFVLNNGRGVAVNSQARTLELNKWQHVALTYDSSRFPVVRMFVDGVEVGVAYPLDGNPVPDRPISDNRNLDLYMGESASGARAFKGRMTEFRLWNEALSPTDIFNRHAVRLEGNEPGLQFYLSFDQTLEPVAISRGYVPAIAEISGAQRVPLELPWADLVSRFNFLTDSGSGWWFERTLGWIYGDLHPWIFLPTLDWVYVGHGESANRFILYGAAPNWGWVQTGPGLFPWFYHYTSGTWFWYLEGTQSPAWYYSKGLSDWFSSASGFPEF